MNRFGEFVLFSILASTTALGCDASKTDTGAAAGVSPAVKSNVSPAAPVPAVTPASVTEASPRFDEEAFEVSLELPSTVKQGEAFEAKVQLKAKAGYKVNQEYPLKFAFAEANGVSYEVPILRREQGNVEKTTATLRGKVTVGRAGAVEVTGKLSFSVCTEERCLIEKRDLKGTVTAS